MKTQYQFEASDGVELKLSSIKLNALITFLFHEILSMSIPISFNFLSINIIFLLHMSLIISS